MIYGLITSKGNTYQLVATGWYFKTSGFIEAKFKETEFKRLKFVFKKSDQNWATLAEIKFYKNDELAMENGNEFVDRLVYTTRQDGAKWKGFPSEYELYASNAESGNAFRKIAEESYSGNAGDFFEIKFSPTKAKRFKFVFKNAKDSWASALEFWMYKEDKLRATLGYLFVDSSKNGLKEQYKDMKKINAKE